MNNSKLKQQIIDAISAGKIQATTIVFGDQVQNKINVEDGGHIQIINGQPSADNSDQRDKQSEHTADSELPIPREGNYNEVRLYIAERQKTDSDFKTFCKCHNRKQLCAYLTTIFHWVVDDHALGTNINRH